MMAWKKILIAISLSLISASLQAQQTDDELEAQMKAAEAQLRASEEQMQLMEVDRVAELAEAERIAEVAELDRLAQAEDVELRMREAEQRLAEAAQQIAELSTRQLPRVAEIERRIRIDGRPVLGVTVGSDKPDGPVEGVKIIGVTPGGAAEEAGLRTGDVITTINGESLTSDTGRHANTKLLDFMAGVEEGDVLEIDYLRNGKSENAEVTPRARRGFAFAFGDGDFDFHMPPVPAVPGTRHGFVWSSNGFGNMEMVALTEGLGRYFGADKGLLIVRAPEDNDFDLQDGDVIQSIDGREPTSVKHAMRILSSYESGEKLDIVIMRDKRKKTISIEMPDNRRGQHWNFSAPKVKSRVITISPRVERKVDERT